MRILVQKFGGTSVSTEESRQKAVEKIKAAKENQRDEMRFIQILDEVIGEHD